MGDQRPETAAERGANAEVARTAATRQASERLRRRRDFQALMRDSRLFRHRLLTLRSRPNQLDHSRVGYAVGRPVGGAVVRNRVRRRLRELVRTLPIRPGYDVVIAARPSSRTASYREIGAALESCSTQASILTGENR